MSYGAILRCDAATVMVVLVPGDDPGRGGIGYVLDSDLLPRGSSVVLIPPSGRIEWHVVTPFHDPHGPGGRVIAAAGDTITYTMS